MENVDTAFNRALKYLSFRARSGYEIRKYLSEKEYPHEIIDAVLDKLSIYGYINDVAFSQALCECYQKKEGKRAVRDRLKRAGVSDTIIKNTLEYDESEGAYLAAQKYLRIREFDRDKLFRHLFNKGFGSSAISAAIAKITEE